MAGAQVVHHGLLSSRCPRRARITGEGIRRPHIRPARDVYRYETAATATSRIPATRGACPPSARHGEGAGKVSWRRRQEGPWKWQERARSEELNREVPRLLELGGERSGAKASGKARRGLDRAERLVRRCAGLTAGPARRRGRLVGEGHPGARDDLGGGGAEASAARHRGRHPTPVRGAGRDRRLQRPRDRDRSASVPGRSLRRRDETHARLVDFIRSQPEGSFGGQTRARRRLRLDTYGHYPEHTAAIRAWRERLPA